MAEDSRRYISRRGVSEGPYTVDELYDMAFAKEINFQTFFYSEVKKTWAPLSGLMMDIDPEQMDRFVKAGIKRIRVLGSDTECPACAAVSGKTFSVKSPPELPPAGCRCVPWCRLVLTAVQD